MEIAALYNIFLDSKGISTDTRTLQPGELFLALSGENFDGNQFVHQALEQGASHAVCTNAGDANSAKCVVVDDVLQSLQQLATYHRMQLGLPIIALTGSNGKTTTKELILSVLSTQYEVKGTQGNLNNHIGVPLTLLSFTQETEIGVVEMGANHLLEIKSLCKIAMPDYGMITNYGKAHLEGFGSEQGIIRGKSEIYDHLKEHNKTAVVVSTDSQQMERSQDLRRVLTPAADLIASNPVSIRLDNRTIKTGMTGAYNFNNALLAIAVGRIFDIDMDLISRGLSSYVPSNNRSQIIKQGKATIILDAYNANPTSMAAALENLATYPGTKTAIMGDMFELGNYSSVEHKAILKLAQDLKIDRIITVGNEFLNIKTSGIEQFENVEKMRSQYSLDPSKNQTILIKGSRGMALERLLKAAR
jgi:UDP-N-acetylmuramoyl-tripeptide--D-alanyl-D-alanine ligase